MSLTRACREAMHGKVLVRGAMVNHNAADVDAFYFGEI
jgi:hypothetical protein